MKTSKLFLAIIVFIIVAGCIKITSPNNPTVPINDKGEYAIVFSNSSAATKATVTTIAGNGYDEFSLYAWNSSGDIVMNPFIVQADGDSSYKYDGVSGQSLQYFKNSADSYSFIGVIPTSSTTLDNGSVKVGVESFVVDDKRAEGNGIKVDSPKEFLWARADVVKANYRQTVTLPFQHGNALLYLGFISDDAATEIIDYTPHVDAQSAQPAVPGTETYTKKTTKFIDELVAGSEVQVAIGFCGAGSSKLTNTQPNPIYVGTNNGTWKSKDWLLSIKDDVNAQFVYYRLNEVNNSTSKTVTTEDWESAASNKNIFMMKLADGVDKAEFAAGNDVFSTALKAHQTDWYGGSSPAQSFWAVFEKAYNEGWRVIRINVSDTNANQVLVFLSSNVEKTTQVCEITGGTPAIPAVPESGFKGIRVFSAKADATNGYAHLAHTKTADATIATGLAFDNRATVTDSIQFSLPANTIIPVGTTESDAVYSPTTFYAIPGDADLTHFVVKLSYTYKGTTVYDVRVPITLPTTGLEAGKYYKYIINITSTANGIDDPNEANNKKDDISITKNPIKVAVDVTDYTEGHTEVIKI